MKIEIFTFIYHYLGKIRNGFSIPKCTENGAESGTHLPDEEIITEAIAKVQNVRRLLLEERGS
ncbi:MAG: hypothetical protein JXB38_01455 [Anaerolineales bacterium]|nr:hypothetical protein [Anaerolineales bacterium]